MKSNRLARNTFYNMLGQGLPLMAALVTIPALIEGLGTERFGMLILVWMLIGYASVFDFGLGRATTKYVSELLAGNDRRALPSLVWTSLISLSCLGLLAGTLIWMSAPMIARQGLNVPGDLDSEIIMAISAMAVSLPFVLATTALRGILEAQHRFALVNAIAIPASLANYLLPFVLLHFTENLYHIVLALVATRLLLWAAYAHYSLNSISGLMPPSLPRLNQLRKLLGFGGWLTVSAVIGPLMVYFDRFLIANLLTPSAVAYYATPYDLISKFSIVATALTTALFPTLSALPSMKEQKYALLHYRVLKALLLITLPVVVLVMVLAEPLLALWINEDFAARSGTIAQILVVGMLVNSLALVQFIVIQAAGRTDISAKLHLCEFPVYAILLWVLISGYGLVGAAIAWVLRALIDFLAMSYVAAGLTGVTGDQKSRSWIGSSVYVVVFLVGSAGAAYSSDISFRICCALALAVAAVTSGWLLMLTSEDRASVMRVVTSRAKAV